MENIVKELQYAQLGMVLFNPTLFYRNPTNRTDNFLMEIFQSSLTPPKVIESERDYNMHN